MLAIGHDRYKPTPPLPSTCWALWDRSLPVFITKVAQDVKRIQQTNELTDSLCFLCDGTAVGSQLNSVLNRPEFMVSFSSSA